MRQCVEFSWVKKGECHTACEQPGGTARVATNKQKKKETERGRDWEMGAP